MSDTTNRAKKQVTLETLDKANSRKSSRLMRSLLIALALFALLGSGGYAAYKLSGGEVTTSRFAVIHLDCPGCINKIDKALGSLPGMMGYDVNFAAQTVSVEHQSGTVSADAVKQALESVRFAVIHEGTAGEHALAATVNGHPVFAGEMVSLLPEFGSGDAAPQTSELFFDTVVREILLQAAGAKQVLVSNRDMQMALGLVSAKSGLPFQEALKTGSDRLGSPAKYQQILLQRQALLKFASGRTQPAGDIPTWIAGQLEEAVVTIESPELKRTLQAELGTADWNRIWPQMLSKNTELLQVMAW